MVIMLYVLCALMVLHQAASAHIKDIFAKQTRTRRNIFEKDDRIKVPNEFTQKYPLHSVVRLSNGCSGTLIWHQHVLTSAHCVHNHTHFFPSVRDIEIGLLDSTGNFEWFQATNVFVPNVWETSDSPMKHLNHDYAVVRLDRLHNRQCMPLSVTNELFVIHFAGFSSDDNRNQMFFSFCQPKTSNKNLIFSYCDATAGMSGSGVFITKNNIRYLIGVFSSYVDLGNVRIKGIGNDANVAIRLTTKKIRRICKWIGAETDCYKLHPSVQVVED